MSQGILIRSPLDKSYPITTKFTDITLLGPRKGQQHNALDYSVPVGTPIYAVAGGIITRADNADPYGGNTIQLHNTGANFDAIYAHLSKMVVSKGQTVKAGDLIGYSGGAIGAAGSGMATTGPHLYFETRINGKPIDPNSIMSSNPFSLINVLGNPPGSGNATVDAAGNAIDAAAGIPGAIGDAAFTFGIILVGAVLILAAVLVMRSGNGSS